ncbi:MAG TPA: deaminase [Clostridia bacterium]|nr:deaminase [Clostridia bacterium]
MERIIFGLTGAFGSGCSFLAEHFFVKNFAYRKYSLSDELKHKYALENGEEYKSRSDLQKFGNEVRRADIAALAKAVLVKINADDIAEQERAKTDGKEYHQAPIIIDSIRNPAEIEFFRANCPSFVLFAIFADYDTRWDRVKADYNESKDAFDRDEAKDQGSNEPSYGQRITSCFFQADVVISNNSEINPDSPNEAFENMRKNLLNYTKAFSEPTKSKPTIQETVMAMAYAVGRRSKCIKRRVGAVIVDGKMRVLSTGFNAAPVGLKDCEQQIGNCYRATKKKKLHGEIHRRILMDFPSCETKVADDIISKFKILELCRALHAEENAILSLVGHSFGTDLTEATLYTTTYPCNLCANKIVQVGIKHVIYFEPYPVKEAKKIFEEAKVKAEGFEGVTFRAFFRAFNFEE